MDVVVLGLGYIGLPTAAMLACAGHRVIGVDSSERVVEQIRSGCSHVAELDVRALAHSAIESGNFTVASTLPFSANAFIICVPTPTHEHKPDLHYVKQAADAVAARANAGNLIVLESTVPPGTVEDIVVRALEMVGKSPDTMYIAHCPERVIPGAIVHELRHNARVIGGRRPLDAQHVRDLYTSICDGEISLTDCLTAELVKVVENTFRDVNLAFANELALLAEALGVDAWEVIGIANKHPRVNILKPGPGVGGHCIPVDPNFLASKNPFLTELIQTARRVNERMPHAVARLVDETIAVNRAAANIVLLGAAYKADVEDTRESPASAVLHLLQDRRYNVTVYDPLAREFEDRLSKTLEHAATDADAIVLITDHTVFRTIDPVALAPLVRRKILIDTRNFFDRERWTSAGFIVRTLGDATPASELTAVRTA